MQKRTVLIGIAYFLFFALLFFFMIFWMASRGSSRPWEYGGSKEQIALVRIEGLITDSEEITKILTRLSEDDRVKAILLRIDSPGGAVAPAQEIYEAIKTIRDKGEKKVVTSMGTIAASGGYYIASASHFIMTNPGTLTGSLGVIMTLSNLEGLLQKIGVKSVVLKAGKNKDVGSPFRAMTKEEAALLQAVLDDVHDQFIEAVAVGRALPKETLKRFAADGRILTGRQAKEVGLVDGLGGLEEAISKAAEMAGIRGKPKVVETQGFSLLRRLQANLSNRSSYFSPLRLDYVVSF